MALALGNFVGFETQGLEEAMSTAGTPAASTTNKKTGSYGLRLNATGSNYDINPFIGSTDQLSSQICGFWLYIDTETITTGATRYIFAGVESSTSICQLGIYHDGTNLNLRLASQEATTTSTGSTNLSLDTWYFIEVRFTHSATGAADVYLDGSSECSIATGDFDNGGTFDRWRFVGFNQIDYYADNFYCYSGASGVGDFLGDCEVYAHVVTNETTATPDYAGVATADTPSAATGGTGSPAGRWDETDDYLTSTYIIYGDGAGGGADGIALNASITENPVGVKGIWHMKRTAGDTAVTHYGVIGNSGDGVINTVDFNPDVTYDTEFYVSESGTVVPLSSEELRLGVEVVE